MADLAHADLMTRYHDAQHDGFYWSIDASAGGAVRRPQGRCTARRSPSRVERIPRRHRLGSAMRWARLAVFRLLEKHARERQFGGYLEAFSRDWSPIADMRLSDVDQNDPKSQEHDAP